MRTTTLTPKKRPWLWVLLGSLSAGAVTLMSCQAPPRSPDRLLLTIRGQRVHFSTVAFSPDGKWLATGTAANDTQAYALPGDVKIWEATSGRSIFTLTGHAGLVSCVKFSLDGKRLASGSFDKTLKVWDALTARELLTVKGLDADVLDLDFSPDGNLLACALGDHTARVYDAATGALRVTLQGHHAEVTGVAFRPDGRRLATGSLDKTVRIWDVAKGKELQTLPNANTVKTVGFSHDGKRIVSASGGVDRDGRQLPGGMEVWDIRTGKQGRRTKACELTRRWAT
jgi:WD40 repeat protein